MNSKMLEGESKLTIGVTKTRELPDEYLDEINDALELWFGTREEGSTKCSKNTIGDSYITFAIAFTGSHLLKAFAIFERDIDDERNRTGLLSVRSRPHVRLGDNSYYQPVYEIRARIVAYYGATPDFDW